MAQINIPQLVWRRCFPVLAACAPLGVSLAVAGQLPVPCAPAICGAAGPTTLAPPGQATAVATPNNLNVTQISNQAVLNWASFNIDAGSHVNFNQPSSSAIALNRVFQASPSTIFGSLSANGQIYLINQNGIVFGRSSQVNVGGLIASTLDMPLPVFTGGALAPILLQTKTAALQSDGRAGQVDNAGNPILGPDGKQLTISLVVEPGAQLSTNAGGQRILLASQQVTNGGSISAPDGQIVMAAGQFVYLQASADPALRGLIVEVDKGGTAWNQLTGQLSAPRGNISLVGLAVNQEGRISSTTTVAANGSISLVAADTTQFTPNENTGAVTISPTKGGVLTLGPQSQTTVTPELTDTQTAVHDQPPTQSRILLTGDQVLLKGGARIVAPAGSVTVSAQGDPSDPTNAVDPNARVHMESGAVIDVSGSVADLPMSANLVSVQLRANELADDPTQRNGALRGKTVIMDARVGTPIANVQGAIDAIPQNIAQRTATGGKVSLISQGDVVIAPGATINVSGGGTQFAGGSLLTSKLVTADGQLVDIGSANPLASYVGVYNPTTQQVYNRWGVTQTLATPGSTNYESGYFQGADAGSITIAGRALVLQGALIGHATNGPFQRTSSSAALGGELTIGFAGGVAPVSGVAPDYLAPSVEFVNQAPPIVVADNTTLAPQTLLLPVDYIQNGGFTRTQIFSNGDVTLAANTPLNLSTGGSLSVRATGIDLLSSITAPGGALSFTSVETAAGINPNGPRPGIDVGDGVTLDVRGNWTNDAVAALTATSTAAPAAPTFYDGGSINLALTAAGSQMILGSDVQLRVSGGAWLPTVGALVPGKGGSINLRAGGPQTALEIDDNVRLDGFGVVGASGGSFSLEAPTIEVRTGDAFWAPAQRVDTLSSPAGPFLINASLFNQFGFSTFSLNASASQSASNNAASLFTILAGTAIHPQAQSSMLLNLAQPSGNSIDGFSVPVLLPEASRPAVDLTLSAVPRPSDGLTNRLGSSPGNLAMQPGTNIQVDAGGSIALEAAGSVIIGGKLIAPGGTVSVTIPTPPGAAQDDNVDDKGYIANQRIELLSGALIDVSGAVVLQPNALGLHLGSVLAGGTVNLLAERGSIRMDPGSEIDASGTAARLDVVTPQTTTGYSPQAIASAGGSISLSSPESISLQGALHAAAGSGGALPVSGGNLTVDLSTSHFSDTLTLPFPYTTRVVELAETIPPGTAPESGQALLSAPQLMASGIDALTLIGADKILLDSGMSANFGRSLTLESPILAVSGNGAASLSAPYLAVSNVTTVGTLAPSTGLGSLTLSANFIDLIGPIVFQDIGAATLTSTGDIRLQGSLITKANQGSLAIAGGLTLDAARIYPATQTTFAITDTGSTNNVVQIGQTYASPGAPLSVNGSLTITADTISSAGTVLAPFGQINLDGNQAVNLQPGSTTSVSGSATTFLYGSVANGTQWLYTLAGSPLTVGGVPSRAVTLQAPAVTIAKGATVDVSGGGDLYAYDWIPGTGGLKDALASTNSRGLFAVVPALAGQLAPFDPQESSGFAFGANQSIYLSGIAGLPAGLYPLLPARYALLPGAFLVTAASGFQNIAPGQTGALADGTPVIAGRMVYANTNLGGAQYSGFAIYPGSYGRKLAQYDDSLASTFFAKQAAAQGLPVPASVADGGRLLVAVDTTLNAAGSVLTAAAAGGRGADIEIAATRLDVLGPQGVANDGGATITASVIQSWHPGELLLGGIRSSDGKSIDVTASAVTIGSGAELSAADITVVAGQKIDVQSGATVASASGLSGQPLSALPKDAPVSLTGTDAAGAAFLAVSDQGLALVTRPVGAAPVAAASIAIEPGATLETRGALVLDGVGDVALAGNLQGPGARWSLGASQITFDNAVQGLPGAEISTGLLAQLAQAATLRLATPGSINVLTDVSLGTSSLAAKPSYLNLTIDAAAIQDTGSFSVLLGAQQITLQGAGAAIPTVAAASGGGDLVLSAGEIDVGPGYLSASGFSSTTLQVAGAMVGRGQGGLAVGGNLSINAAQITAASGSDTTLTALQGTLAIGTSATSAVLPPASLGGALTLNAQTLIDQGAIVLPSGQVNLQASHHMELDSGAVIDVSGVSAVAAGRSVGAPGGTIALLSGGDLLISSGASMAANGAGGASAGSVQINAAGAASVSGTLSAAASGSGQGGAFLLAAGSLSNGLTDLIGRLQTGGFSLLQSVRVNSGDLSLARDAQMSANKVDLEADAGSIQIDGKISAPGGAQRGSISINGANGVILSGTGQLRADAAGGTRGGEIQIGTTAGTIDLRSGSVISAQGSAQKGNLRLRAPAVGNDVAIGGIGSDVSGIGNVIVEPMLGSGGSAYFAVGPAVTDSDFAAIQGQVSTFMSNAASGITARLALDPRLAPTGAMIIEPAVELRQSGDLKLATNVDLSTWGQPIDLTVRAGGSLTLSGSLSDGFVVTGHGAKRHTVLIDAPSSSISLVAGADFSAANLLATVGGAAADLTLSAGSLVRTGTGDLSMVAARDVVIDAVNTGGGPAASIYTGGTPGVANLVVNSSLFNFPTDGGNVLLRAGRDVLGTPVAQSVSDWQIRQGNDKVASAWGVNFDQFQWGAGALGGGDLTVQAGRDVLNLTAAVADSLGLVKSTGSTGVQTLLPSGSLRLDAGRDVGAGQFFEADGVGVLNAGDSFTSLVLDTNPIGTLLELGYGQLQLNARNNITIAGVLNPTILKKPDAPQKLDSQYFSYGDASALQLLSTAGTIAINGDTNTIDKIIGAATGNNPNGEGEFTFYPGTLIVHALSGDIDLNAQGVTLVPTGGGQLDLFAGYDIVGGGVSLIMSDATAGSVPTAANPGAPTSGLGALSLSPSFGGVRHLNDPVPVLVTAGEDITGLFAYLPKQADISAGRDILNLNLLGQNLNAGDLTLISAGRDVAYPSAVSTTYGVEIGGPGRLDVIAGRNVDLGISNGLVTTGNLADAELPTAAGADLTVVTGASSNADYAGFVSKIIAPSSSYQQQLITYTDSVTGQDQSSYASAQTVFDGLSADLQRPLIDQVFFNALLLSGRAANSTPGAGFTSGYAAIDALFPASRTSSGLFAGDLSMAFSRIYTLAGGGISLLVPGGAIDVGLANPPAGGQTRAASQLGIVTEKSGPVNIYTQGDVLVNQSRIFTLDGGNILIWSDQGSIDAGRGSKSSISAPPPIVQVSNTGTVTLDLSTAVTGSGIRTVQTDTTVTPGDVDLIAPVGTVNAGDAGIGAAGNINIAAQHVLGLDNIQFGGSASGVPAQVSSLGASLAGATSAATGANSAATGAVGGGSESKETAPLAQAALNWLDVFVTGLGEDACKPEDNECLKRQKHN